MQPLTEYGQQKIRELADRHGISIDAAMSMLQAVVYGGGSMAQFNIQELGGGGQWMRGGMTMVGDMFNYGLKAKVDGLCADLSHLVSQQPFLAPAASSQSQWQGGGGQQQSGGYGGQQQSGGFGGQQQSNGYGSGSVSLFVPGQMGGGGWWPSDLGSPNSSGGQNNVRYAYFAGSRRLAVDLNGEVTVYDTLDNQIGGVSQQQGMGGSLTFTSQYGTVSVASLPIISINGVSPQRPAPPSPQQYSVEPTNAFEGDIFAKIERLADLKEKGILSAEEFAAKKSELLSRL